MDFSSPEQPHLGPYLGSDQELHSCQQYDPVSTGRAAPTSMQPASPPAVLQKGLGTPCPGCIPELAAGRQELL